MHTELSAAWLCLKVLVCLLYILTTKLSFICFFNLYLHTLLFYSLRKYSLILFKLVPLYHCTYTEIIVEVSVQFLAEQPPLVQLYLSLIMYIENQSFVWCIILFISCVSGVFVCFIPDEAFKPGHQFWRWKKPAFGGGISSCVTARVHRNMRCWCDSRILRTTDASYHQEMGKFCRLDSA